MLNGCLYSASSVHASVGGRSRRVRYTYTGRYCTYEGAARPTCCAPDNVRGVCMRHPGMGVLIATIFIAHWSLEGKEGALRPTRRPRRGRVKQQGVDNSFSPIGSKHSRKLASMAQARTDRTCFLDTSTRSAAWLQRGGGERGAAGPGYTREVHKGRSPRYTQHRVITFPFF